MPRPVGTLCDIGAFEGAQPLPFYWQNLIQYGDAEAAAGSTAGVRVGTPYWTLDTGQFTAVTYNAPGGFPSVATDNVPSIHGENFFAGGPAALSVGSQLINVNPLGAAIDAGGVHYTLSADLGGYGPQGDNAVLSIIFLDGTATRIGSPEDIGPVLPADRGNQTGFRHLSRTSPVPAGTRQIKVVLTQTATTGYNDGYAENLSLLLTPPYALMLPLVRK